jgi:large subunit ribosomal protein L7/L12
MADVADNVKQLGDQLVGLSLKEAVDLGEYLKEEYGIEPASAGVAVAAPGAGGGEAGAEAEEQTEFDVVLKDVGDQKIKVIKVVREATGQGLKEAKDLVAEVPATLASAMSKEDAENLKSQIEEAGGTAELQ